MWNRGNLYQYVDKFENNFFNLRSGLGNKDCEDGSYLYSSDPDDYSVTNQLLSMHPVLKNALINILQLVQVYVCLKTKIQYLNILVIQMFKDL